MLFLKQPLLLPFLHHKSAITFQFDSYKATHSNLKPDLFYLPGKCCIWGLMLQIYKKNCKTLHDNPAFTKNYFVAKATSYNHRRNDVLSIPKVKTTNDGIISISFLGPMIRNSLPNEIKSSRNSNQFKTLIKDWFFFENKCACNVCTQ